MTQVLALANAIDQFITGCKTDGTWGAIKSSCVLAGWNNLDGALTPLVGTAPTNFNFWGSADPSWANVSLLLRMNGANASTAFTDSSSNALTVSTFGNAQISTAQSKFGGSSGLFDGTGDYLTFTGSALTDFGSGDFTIEMWARFNGTTDANGDALITIGDTATNRPVGIYRTSTGIEGWISTGGTNYQPAQRLTSILSNTWYHIAFTRNSNVLRVFVDGVQGSTVTVSGATPAYSGPVHIGRLPWNASSDLPGNIDDFRITKGVARYTTNFTPPTQTFPGSTTDYNRETGLVGDGSTKYLASNYAFTTLLQDNCHTAGFFSTVDSVGIAVAGYGDAGANGSYLGARGARLYQTSASTFAPSDTTTAGFRGMSRNASVSFVYRRAGVNETASIASSGVTHENQGIYARRRNTGVYDAYGDCRLAFYSIGESLDLALLDTRVTTLVNAIAAAIP